MLSTLLEAVGLVACSLLIFTQLRFTQHVDAALPMLLVLRVLHSVSSSYLHVPSTAQGVRRASRSLRTVRCTKQRSSAEADASVHVLTSSLAERRESNYKEHSGHWLYMTRQLSRQNCPATTAHVRIQVPVQNMKYNQDNCSHSFHSTT